MKIILMLLMFLSSFTCIAQLPLFKTGVKTYDGKQIIQIRVHNIKAIYSDSSQNGFIIKNDCHDTIYVFTTVLENPNMLYSGKNIKLDKEYLLLDSYYEDYMHDVLYSGVKEFMFTPIKPNDSLNIYLDMKEMEKLKYYNLTSNISLVYYYFVKEQTIDEIGILDVNKTTLYKKTAKLSNLPFVPSGFSPSETNN